MNKTNYALDAKERVFYNDNIYYLRLRACDITKPIVLFLHGGCGSPDRAQVIKYQSDLAKYFVIVAYDQRGAGLAYNKKEAKSLDLTKEIYIEGVRNVVQYLKKRFKQDKVIIVGHSFGSTLGVWFAEQYPQDVLAYVGVGQCVDYAKSEEISYRWTLEESKRIGINKNIKILNKIGAPINGIYQCKHNKSLMKQRSILHSLGGATFSNKKPYWQELLFNNLPTIIKEYGFKGTLKYIKGLGYSPKTTLAVTNPEFLTKTKKMEMPVYLLLGRHDYNCPFELAVQWLEQLDAPIKKIIWFENSAHSPQWEEPEEWNKQFVKIFAIGNN